MAACPPRLRPGDTVAVCAPSGPIRRDTVERGLAVVGARYRLVCDTGEHGIFARAGLFAGDDARRAGELNGYLRDPDVRAIFCARGGHGLLRLLPLLDAGALAADPKLLIGFSDITLLLAWAHRAGVRGVHGPVVTQLGRLAAGDQAALFALLETAAAPPPLSGQALAGGIGRGPLLGGNLELTSRLLGTPWALPLAGAVFFAEDIDERPYRIDRILAHHVAAGSGRPAALALGDFTRCDPAPEAPPVTTADVFAGHLAAHPLPALGGLPFGHGERNVALPYGARAVVNGDAGQLVFEEAAVA